LGLVAKEAQVRKNEARERARIRREQERRKARQRKTFTYGGVIVGVLAVIAAVVIVGVTRNSSKDTNANAPASAVVTNAIAGVPSANYDLVGKGTTSGGVSAVVGQPALVADGKPEVLYIGAEYCPYCAAERWAMVTALARFGTFSDLQTTLSSSNDVNPNTATLSFVAASYKSDYLTFTTREIQDRTGKALQQLTSDQKATFSAIAPKGGIPFFDIANKYFVNGAQFNPDVLKGLTADQIAGQLGNPGTDVGKAVLGSANLLTAAMCASTGNKPANVCTSSAVTTAAASLTSGTASGSS
jgi:thiol-disulfide isomerase/thioredoxin